MIKCGHVEISNSIQHTVLLATLMSDYDDFFDAEIDESFLNEVNALDSNVAATNLKTTSKPSPTRRNSDHEFDDDFSFPSEVELVAAAAERRFNQGTSRSRQTTLTGSVLPYSPVKEKPQANTPFGQKARKTKIWDKTAFAKTGWRSTKAKDKKGKGKASAADNEDGEMEVQIDDLSAPFMPGRYIP